MNQGYQFGKSKGTLNHLLSIDDLKIYGENKRGFDSNDSKGSFTGS